MQNQEIEISVEELALDLIRQLEDGDSEALTEKLDDLHPSVLSDVLLIIPENLRNQYLQHITGLDSIAGLVAHAQTQLREKLLQMLDDSRLAAVIRRLDLDDAADVLSCVPRRRQVRILKRLNSSLVKELTTLLSYDAQTAGGIMNPRFFGLRPEETAGSALGRLKTALLTKEIDDDTDLSNCFVLNSNGSLVGVVTLRQLLSATDSESIESIMDHEVISISAESDQVDAAWKIADFDISSLPVISDEGNILLGIITVDDILDVIEEEHDYKISKLVGTEQVDRVGSSVFVSLKSRIPWLIASFTGGTLGAALLGNFTTVIEKFVALAFFMPVVFGMGGNVGSQSSTITVRGLATGELSTLRFIGRAKKELLIGTILGLLFSVLLAGASYFMFKDLSLSMVVGISIIATIMCASTIGSILPVLFEKVGIDPAIAAGPLVSTSTDILSIIIYFSIATLLLN